MTIRRVVTATNSHGKSVVVSDGPSPREQALQYTPGFISAPLWELEARPELGTVPSDPMERESGLLAAPGGSVFLVLTIPPDAVMASSDFDPAKAGAEHAAAAPGIAETFEIDEPGMHRTPTLDYVTVVKGSVVLELDDGMKISLSQGDTIVQHGARHAWRNPGTEPATLSFVMLGSARDS